MWVEWAKRQKWEREVVGTKRKYLSIEWEKEEEEERKEQEEKFSLVSLVLPYIKLFSGYLILNSVLQYIYVSSVCTSKTWAYTGENKTNG